MTKKHTLKEHIDDLNAWWWQNHKSQHERQGELLFFIAYERWLNDRELLTTEDVKLTDEEPAWPEVST